MPLFPQLFPLHLAAGSALSPCDARLLAFFALAAVLVVLTLLPRHEGGFRPPHNFLSVGHNRPDKHTLFRQRYVD